MRNLLYRWKALWHPERYHGWGRNRDYFESWYYKIVSPREDYALALTPGVVMHDANRHQAFIQEVSSKNDKAIYHDLPPESFYAQPHFFEIGMGGNVFSRSRMKLDLPGLKGEVQFHNQVSWPKRWNSPGIMGWYSFMPSLQCYHGIISLDHGLSGQLDIAGKMVDFTGGKGYIEKDWGRSFPSSWIWIQSNHFKHDTSIALTASVASTPWLGRTFVGYLVGFWLNGKLYRFTSYSRARMKAAQEEETTILSFKNRRHQLEITVNRISGLAEETPHLMKNRTDKVNKSLQAIIRVKLFERGSLIFEGVGRNAALDTAGPIEEELLTREWRR